MKSLLNIICISIWEINNITYFKKMSTNINTILVCIHTIRKNYILKYKYHIDLYDFKDNLNIRQIFNYIHVHSIGVIINDNIQF